MTAHLLQRAGCTVVDEFASEGLFVVGNGLDPTALSLTSFEATSTKPWLPVAMFVGVLGLVGGGFIRFRKRH